MANSLLAFRMKAIWIFISILSAAVHSQVENTWEPRADFGGLKRTRAVGISIGDYGYVGTGVDTAEIVHTDWWRYDPLTDIWAQMADVPGDERRNAIAFVVNDMGYVGCGMDSATSDLGTKYFDLHEYDPSSNSWSPEADFPGGFGDGVYQAAAVGLDDFGYVVGGKWFPNFYSDETWQYEPATDTWTPLVPFPGGVRHQLSGFAVEGKCYFGMGTDNDLYRKDWWCYDPLTFSWSPKADLPGTERAASSTFVIQSRAFLVFGSDGGYLGELWEYNPFTDSWNVKNTFDGSERKYGIAFAIADSGYAGLGQGVSGKKSSFQRYAPSMPVSVAEITSSDLVVFPNPLQSNSIVSLPHEFSAGHYAISDMAGKVIFTGSFEQNYIPLEMLSAEPTGTYFISLSDTKFNYVATTKILVR